jgi:hypothetical protein
MSVWWLQIQLPKRLKENRMTKLRPKRPSPALIISILALCVALGGTAWAAGKIGTKNLKKNAVTAAKIKKNAVTTAKIKKHAVTGSKVKLSSLGTVPSATSAVNATNAVNATSATNATNATNFSRYATTGLKKASVGEDIVLATVGPFTVHGHCEDLGGGEFYAYTFLTTGESGSFMYSSEGDAYEEGGFDPGTEAVVGNYAQNTDPEWAGYSGYYSDWTAASPSGSVLLQGFANNGVHVFGADCAFQAHWTDNA